MGAASTLLLTQVVRQSDTGAAAGLFPGGGDDPDPELRTLMKIMLGCSIAFIVMFAVVVSHY